VTRHSPRHYSTPLGSFAAPLGWLKNPRARVDDGLILDMDMDRWSGNLRGFVGTILPRPAYSRVTSARAPKARLEGELPWTDSPVWWQ
jgi:hypothetical protein